MTDLDNPFAAPETVELDASRAVREKVDLWVLAAGTVVFVANLVVPMLFATMFLDDAPGYLAILVACLVLLFGGWRIMVALPAYSRSILIGALVVAASQLFPVLQLFAGMVGVGIATGFGMVNRPVGPSHDPDHMGIETLTACGAFVVTLVVGAILLALSVGIGVLFRTVWNAINGGRTHSDFVDV